MDEPVAWYYAGSDIEGHSVALDADLDDAQKANCIPLYAAPLQREWKGLTEAERIDIIDEEITAQSTEHFALAQAIEAKLKEKNNG